MTYKRKEILFILNSLEGGGAEKVFIDLLKHFDYTKYKVTLLLIYKSGHHLSNVPKEVDVISLFGRKKKQIENYIAYYLKSTYHTILHYLFRKKVGNRHFDAAISYTEGYPILLQSFINDHSCKRIAWVHCDMIKFHWCAYHFKSIEEEVNLYTKMDYIICVSKQVQISMQKFLSFERKIQVIHNVIDQENILSLSKKSLSIAHKKFTICHVGRLIPAKRQDRIIYVAAELKLRGYDFDVWIVGSGVNDSALKKLTIQLDLSDMVHFLGFKANPYPYMAASDAFILTSDTEGYPTVICEALCLGIPVVSTNINAASEILTDNSGILTSFEIKEIADRLEELMTKPRLYNHFANQAKLKAKQFDPKTIVAQIEQLID